MSYHVSISHYFFLCWINIELYGYTTFCLPIHHGLFSLSGYRDNASIYICVHIFMWLYFHFCHISSVIPKDCYYQMYIVNLTSRTLCWFLLNKSVCVCVCVYVCISGNNINFEPCNYYMIMKEVSMKNKLKYLIIYTLRKFSGYFTRYFRSVSYDGKDQS